MCDGPSGTTGGETQRADLTAADLLVRGSVAVGVFAALLWLIFR
jgi:hypothetical protein